jgi:hypothetical protein
MESEFAAFVRRTIATRLRDAILRHHSAPASTGYNDLQITIKSSSSISNA